MKRILFFALVVLSLASCKQNDWADWKAQNELFLKNNAAQEGIVTTPSGLQYRIIYPGNTSDVRPNSTSVVVVDYTFSLINGRVVEQNSNARFLLSSVVPGFAEGLRKLHVHGDIELYIPWQLGYDSKGNGLEGNEFYIPPYSTLIYKVHLSAVTD